LSEFLAGGIDNFEIYLPWGYYIKMFDICIKFPNSINRAVHSEAMFEGPQMS